MIENASRYRIDIRTDDSAFYYWMIRDPKREIRHKTCSFEDRQECVDTLIHVIIKKNWWNIPIYDENGDHLITPEGEGDLDKL